MLFKPAEVYYETGVMRYPLGRELVERFTRDRIPLKEIISHNRIEELRAIPDSELLRKKKVLVLGIRKSLRLVPNDLSADYIVPFTSSGCAAHCYYCYLMCTFFSNSYLRIFVNREEIWRSIEKKALNAEREYTFELGSNSDMVLEDSITGNLRWAVERFALLSNGRATLSTKFARVGPLLELDHRSKTTIRISVNPREYIRKVEKGTASLSMRVAAANSLAESGYPLGINLAPVMLLDDWRERYSELLEYLSTALSMDAKKGLFFEIIFMTYGYANEKILDQSCPARPRLLNREIQRPKGRGKLCYREPARRDAEEFLLRRLKQLFPGSPIKYIC